MQVEVEDGHHEVMSAPVEARFDHRPGRGRGVLHFSGTRGYATLGGVKINL